MLEKCDSSHIVLSWTRAAIKDPKLQILYNEKGGSGTSKFCRTGLSGCMISGDNFISIISGWNLPDNWDRKIQSPYIRSNPYNEEGRMQTGRCLSEYFQSVKQTWATRSEAGTILKIEGSVPYGPCRPWYLYQIITQILVHT